MSIKLSEHGMRWEDEETFLQLRKYLYVLDKMTRKLWQYSITWQYSGHWWRITEYMDLYGI